MNRPAKYIIAGARKELFSRAERRSASPRAHVSPSGDLMNLSRELFSIGRTGCRCLSCDAVSRIDAGTSRKGVAASWRQWPGHDLSRVRSRKRFSAISYRRRTEDASSGFSGYRDEGARGRVPASSAEPWQRTSW